MKTAGVKKLVTEALRSLPSPYTEDVIDDVFHAIEKNEAWLAQYKALCDELGTAVVNAWGGKWISEELGKPGVEQVPSRKSKLITSYSRLDLSGTLRRGSLGRDEAVALMADYYKQNKAKLPSGIRTHRELIVELIMEGEAPARAFEIVRENPR